MLYCTAHQPIRRLSMRAELSRRAWMSATAAASAALALTPQACAESPAKDPFDYCLNTSTIRGQNIPIEQEVEIAAKAGYQAIEPWINELDKFVHSGGNSEGPRQTHCRRRAAGRKCHRLRRVDRGRRRTPAQGPGRSQAQHGPRAADRRQTAGRPAFRRHRPQRHSLAAHCRARTGRCWSWATRWRSCRRRSCGDIPRR